MVYKPYEDRTVVMEGVRIIYRNFAGAAGMYNPAGDRNFAVILDDDVATRLEADGWHVKYIKPREEGDEPQPYLPVALHYGGRRPPLVVLVTARGKTKLDEDSVEVLDWVDIANVDLIVRPFDWEVGGKSGRKAYMNEIYVTIRENVLTQKYSDVVDLDELPARAGNADDGGDYIDGEVLGESTIREIER